ncbi:MAG: hypothetical protein AYK22_00495 [Thermoplasmatales archaeon SG8-52-3]|nr:MAG: hypothetical protein AYK22_00495 [Thermoplasmatales archaeon SG8-52-3]
MKKISSLLVLIFIAFSLILSTIVVTAYQENNNSIINLNLCDESSLLGTLGTIVWDNGMDYSGLIYSQWDENKQFDFYIVDDFYFEEEAEISDVYWIGGYWGQNYESGNFDWSISFYYDNTSEGKPDGHPYSPSFAGPYLFTWIEINKEILYNSGNSIYYKFWINLPEIIKFEANKKYWISIWAEGSYPPQSGWGYHKSILLNASLLGSDYFSFPFWTPGIDVQGFDFDMAFQLSEPIGPLPPNPPYIEGPREGRAKTKLCWTFQSEDMNGDAIKYVINWGDGSINETDYNSSYDPIELCHTYSKNGVYAIIAYAEDETGLKSNESTFGISIPRYRELNKYLQLIFEQFSMLNRILNFLR